MKALSIRILILASATLVIPFQSMLAELQVEESFDYAVGQQVTGKGGIGMGWAGPWTSLNGGNRVGAGLNYNDGLFDLNFTGGSLALNGSHNGSLRRLSTGVVVGGSNQVRYISFIAKAVSADYLGVSLFEGTGSERFFMGKLFQEPNWGVARTGEAGYSSTARASAQALLVYRLEFSGARLTVRMYVNPPLSAEPATSVIGNKTYSTFSANYVRIQSGSVAGEGTVDELRIGSTWEDVVPRVEDEPET